MKNNEEIPKLSTKKSTDPIRRPEHYRFEGLPVESIDVIRAVLGKEGFRSFCRGSALKYLIRSDKKGGVEDLKKARVFVSWEIGERED